MLNEHVSTEKNINYDLLFELFPDANFLIENSRIIDCNRSSVKLFGYDIKDELIGKRAFVLSPPEQPDGQSSILKGLHMISSALLYETKRFEWVHQRKNGEDFYAEIMLVLLPIEGRKVISASIRDISQRKEMEEAVVEGENIYKSMFYNNHAVMLLIDPDNGNIIDANPAACIFYGYTTDELQSMNISHVNVLPQEKILKDMQKIKETKNIQCYRKHRLSNGEIRNVEVYSGPIVMNHKVFLYSVIHDVTEKIKAQKRLEESEKKFKTLFNQANDAIFLHQYDERELVGKFIEVNDVACRMLGYTREEMLYMTPKDIDMACMENVIQIFERVKKDRQATFETIFLSKTGKTIPVEINTHYFHLFDRIVILSIARDITARKKIEKALKESEEKYRNLMEFLPDAVFIVDHDEIVYANPYAAKMLNIDSAVELIGKSYLEFVHPEFRKKMSGKVIRGKNPSLLEKKYILKDGSYIDAEFTRALIPFSNKVCTLIVARDVTERNRTKNLLNETIHYENLRTEFFANISHELRTPINVIFGSLQLFDLYIKEGLQGNDIHKIKKYLKNMKQNCYRLLRIINNIIDITKIDSGFFHMELCNYDIVHIIEGIVLSVADFVEQKKIKLEFIKKIDNKIIACDPNQMERIMLNLLSNAIKFTNAGGKIKIMINEIGDHIVLSIKDSGIGIPKDKLDHIFDRFVQVDKSLARNFEGSGIGLALVKSLVEMHGGKIQVKSKIGIGSEFVIKLPIRHIECESTESNENPSLIANVERIHIEFSDIYTA